MTLLSLNTCAVCIVDKGLVKAISTTDSWKTMMPRSKSNQPKGKTDTEKLLESMAHAIEQANNPVLAVITATLTRQTETAPYLAPYLLFAAEHLAKDPSYLRDAIDAAGQAALYVSSDDDQLLDWASRIIWEGINALPNSTAYKVAAAKTVMRHSQKNSAFVAQALRIVLENLDALPNITAKIATLRDAAYYARSRPEIQKQAVELWATYVGSLPDAAQKIETAQIGAQRYGSKELHEQTLRIVLENVDALPNAAAKLKALLHANFLDCPNIKLREKAASLWAAHVNALPDAAAKVQAAQEMTRHVHPSSAPGQQAISILWENIDVWPEVAQKIEVAYTVASYAQPGSKLEKRAIERWETYVDALPNMKKKIEMAQYATQNAPTQSALQKRARTKLKEFSENPSRPYFHRVSSRADVEKILLKLRQS